jgi:hypothetical protein
MGGSGHCSLPHVCRAQHRPAAFIDCDCYTCATDKALRIPLRITHSIVFADAPLIAGVDDDHAMQAIVSMTWAELSQVDLEELASHDLRGNERALHIALSHHALDAADRRSLAPRQATLEGAQRNQCRRHCR